MTEYKILQSFTWYKSLEEQVNSHIKTWWTPLWWVWFAGWWYQSLIKELMIDNKLIEKALALTDENIEDMMEWVPDEIWFWKVFSMEKFSYYLLSRTFTEEYYYKADMSSDWKARYEVAWIFWTAIQDFQEWNEEPLQELLSKIWN